MKTEFECTKSINIDNTYGTYWEIELNGTKFYIKSNVVEIQTQGFNYKIAVEHQLRQINYGSVTTKSYPTDKVWYHNCSSLNNLELHQKFIQLNRVKDMIRNFMSPIRKELDEINQIKKRLDNIEDECHLFIQQISKEINEAGLDKYGIVEIF